MSEKRLDFEDLKETIKTIQASHVMDCTQPATIRYQDMIGHSSFEQLEELANTDVYRETFYRVYGTAYGTVEAIKFYMKHSDKVKAILEEKADLEAERDGLIETDRNRTAYIEEQNAKNIQISSELRAEQRKAQEAAERVAALEAENQALKAKLYDLITK